MFRKAIGPLAIVSVGVLFATLYSVGCGSDGGGGTGTGGKGTGGKGTGGSTGTGGAASGGSGTGGAVTGSGGSATGGMGSGGSGSGGSATGGSGSGGSGSGGSAGGAAGSAGGKGGSAGSAGGAAGSAGGKGGSAGSAGGAGGAAGSAGGAAGSAGGAAGSAGGAAGSAGGAAGSAGGAAGSAGGAAGAAPVMAHANIAVFGNGTITGTASFTNVTNGVQLTVALQNCPAGAHGIHIHAGTACTDATTQGGHWDGAGTQQNPTRGEAIGNATSEITCDANGVGVISSYIRTNTNPDLTWTIGGAVGTNVIGHPIVVHGLTASNREGCGVIQAN